MLSTICAKHFVCHCSGCRYAECLAASTTTKSLIRLVPEGLVPAAVGSSSVPIFWVGVTVEAPARLTGPFRLLRRMPCTGDEVGKNISLQWTNLCWQDKTWAEFSNSEEFLALVCYQCSGQISYCNYLWQVKYLWARAESITERSTWIKPLD